MTPIVLQLYRVIDYKTYFSIKREYSGVSFLMENYLQFDLYSIGFAILLIMCFTLMCLSFYCAGITEILRKRKIDTVYSIENRDFLLLDNLDGLHDELSTFYGEDFDL